MYLNIVVIVMYFVSRVVLSFPISDFILYVAFAKRVVLIVVNALYNSPSSLSRKRNPVFDSAMVEMLLSDFS